MRWTIDQRRSEGSNSHPHDPCGCCSHKGVVASSFDPSWVHHPGVRNCPRRSRPSKRIHAVPRMVDFVVDDDGGGGGGGGVDFEFDQSRLGF